MECNLNKEKIKRGIVDSVKALVTETNLFDIVDDKVISRTRLEEGPVELTEKQQEWLEGSMKYADTIPQQMFRDMFTSNPADFLREIAKQGNSSESEASGAFNIAGAKLFQMALQIFPEEGKITHESEAVRDINKAFKDEVLLKTGTNEWTIWPSDELAMQYLFAQPGSSKAIINEMRADYLSQFSSTSINLLADDLWLNHPTLQDPNIQNLLNFAKKINPDFKVVVTDDLDVNAVSLIRDNIIFIRQGSIISELPEEIAHFFFELLPEDNPIKKEMLDRIVDMPIYAETFRLYQNNDAYKINGRPDIQKIKREAAAKLIGEYIKAEYRNEAETKYGKKRGWLRDIVRKFFKFLRRAFVTLSQNVYTEPIVDLNSPFRQAAQEITKNDISSLDLTRIPSIYDSIFFSKIEDEMPEGYEASDIAKSLYEFSRTLKRQITKTFYTYVEKENMKGLKELLDDPSNKDFNRLWDVVARLDDSGKILKDMMDDKVIDQISMVRATSSLAEAYREMEQIPIAITQVLKKMSKTQVEEELLDNITELQTYFQFSDTFKNITDEFIKMLSFIRTSYPDQTTGVNQIYEKMIERMGATEIRFNVVDEQIMKMLQDHIINLTHKWTDEAFSKYRGEINALHDSLEHHKLKNDVSKLITEKITGIQQIRQAVTGNFPNAKDLLLPDGSKVNINKIKDMSQIDYIIFLFSSPTLIADPFVSSVMAYFTDRYVASMVKGMRESKVFADTISPIKADLAGMGVGWYEAEESIQNVQSFYDFSVEDKKTEKRTFLSSTNRFDFQYQKQVKIQDIVDTSKQVDRLQAEFLNIETTSERKSELKDTLIPEKQKELQQKRDEYEDWLNEWSHRPFTPEFYAKQKILRDKKTDSPSLKRMKEINRKIQILEEKQYIAVAYDAVVNEPLYDQITQELALLQNERRLLQDQVPPTEQDVIDILQEIYEVDEVATSRLRQRHKNQWVSSFVNVQIEAGTRSTKQQLTMDADNKYDYLYTIVVPKKEFYDERNRIFEEISKASRPTDELGVISSRIDELRQKEYKLLKPFRDMKGEVNVTSLRYISLERDENGRDIMLSESLKSIEEEMDILRRKQDIYSRILTSTLNEGDKKNLRSLVEVLMTFGQVINNQLNYKPEDVQKAFAPIISLTTSQADQILSAIRKGIVEKDNSAFANLANLQLAWKDETVRRGYSMIKFESPANLLDVEDQLYSTFKGFARLNPDQISTVSMLYDQLNGLYTNSVSLQYYLALKEFFEFYKEYMNQDIFQVADTDLHRSKFAAHSPADVATVPDIERMLGDGVFEAVLQYMQWKERNEMNPSRSQPLSDLVDFLISIHKQKTTYVDGEAITTWSPITYVRKPIPAPEMTERSAPRFLTRNRIKDAYRSEKVYETDPDVISGSKSANVDINGEWLPLDKENSPFWNKKYADLKNSKTTQGKKEFELLQTMKRAYLQAQVDYLPEGERLDLVIPAKHLDKLEQKKLFLSNQNEIWKYIRNITPFTKGKGIEEEEQNYREDINAVTVQNRDIYTGAIIAEKNVKLRSRRRIPLERTSKDATSSVVMFIEDANEYTAKMLAAPIMKSFSDVFKYAHEQNPSANNLRKGALTDLYGTRILGEVPKNFANNPTIAKALAAVNRLVTFRLLGDPIGAIVNLTSGTIQSLVEANFSKAEYQVYASSGWKAKDWLYQYDKDFYKGSNWGLETQLIATFNMIPDGMELSNHLSKPALWSNVRSKLMAPRSESEKLLAIHLGLSVIMAEPLVHDGKKVSIEEIYELNPVTNLVQLKNEYKSMEKDWNPVDGIKVMKLRRRLMQKYTLLQGNFFRQNQSFASTTAIGKSAEIMKRWFASGVIRRFQGEVVDPYLGETRKGYLLAIGSALKNLFWGVKNGDMKYINEYFSKVAKRPSEKLAIRRAAAEFLYIAVFGILATFVMGYDDDDEDKNKKLREMAYAKQLALLIALRVQGELGTFIPIPLWGLGYMEMKRAVLDPFGLPKGGFDNIMGLGALTVMQIFDALGLGDFSRALEYQKGKPYGYNLGGLGAFKDKGDSKLIAMILNTIGYTGYTFEPAEYIKTLTQMQNRIK